MIARQNLGGRWHFLQSNLNVLVKNVGNMPSYLSRVKYTDLPRSVKGKR